MSRSHPSAAAVVLLGILTGGCESDPAVPDRVVIGTFDYRQTGTETIHAVLERAGIAMGAPEGSRVYSIEVRREKALAAQNALRESGLKGIYYYKLSPEGRIIRTEDGRNQGDPNLNGTRK